MDKNIKNILDDLYAIDKDLKKYEKDLIKIIEKLIAAKPNIKFDENFKSQLRTELLEKFSQTKNKKFNFNFMNKITYTVGALALISIVLVPTLFKGNNNLLNRQLANNIDFGVEIDSLENSAFGVLKSHQTDVSERSGTQFAGFGGGGGMASSESKMIAPHNPVIYNYIYDGEDFAVEENQMAVLKKIKGFGSQADAAGILQSLNFENIDLEALNNAKLRNFTLYEDKDFGYSVNVDLYEGMVTINEYWEKWNIYRQEPALSIKIDDIPADDVLISVANKFLQDFDVNMENYDQPKLEDSWRQHYLRLENKVDFRAPDMVTVIYPLVIDEKEIYEEWGNKQGLRVSINLRNKRPSGVWGLSSNRYQSSLYDVETDTNRILDLASKGGVQQYPMDNAKIIDIKIGTPYFGYVQSWHFEDNINSQLLVPALVFPVTNIPDEAEYFYRENVVVPLVKDIIDQRLVGGLEEPVLLER